MKRMFILFFVGMLLTPGMNAQEYGKFKLGLGGGLATGTSSSSSSGGGGVILTLEPAYRASDNLAIGLRLEAAAYGGGDGSTGFPGGYGSLTANGQYYFSTEEFRPFAGVGMGSYLGKGYGSFGFYPRAGFDLDHFTVALEYNLIASNTSGESVFSYLGLRIGGFFFGGKN